MGFLSTILDIVFPVNCISCKKGGVYLCEDCLLTATEPKRENADWIFTIYDYRNPQIKKAIWLLKYKGKKKIVDIFSPILYDRILEEFSDLSQMENFFEPILIPIPLSQKRKNERGFNQSELICKKLIELDLNKNFKLIDNVLIKPKDTEHQADILNRSARLQNIVGSFTAINDFLVRGRNIILIDDVTTTGATLTEAKKVLKQAGAKKIIAFTIAH